jgi:hypothetical protein
MGAGTVASCSGVAPAKTFLVFWFAALIRYLNAIRCGTRLVVEEPKQPKPRQGQIPFGTLRGPYGTYRLLPYMYVRTYALYGVARSG